MPTLAEVAATLAPTQSRTYRYCYPPLIEQLGDRPIESITALDLLGYREFLSKKYSPSSADTYLNAAKGLIRWASTLNLRDSLDTRAIPSIKRPAVSREVWSREEVRRLIESAQRSDPRAGAWMRLNYLTACRPSETLRLVKGEYVEESSSLVVLSKHKTSHSGQPRFVLLSAAAQVALDDARRARPAKKGKSKDPTCPWNRLDTYSNACYMACGKRPHLLRHSAATSLLEHGVARAEVDLILGHSVGSRVSLTYMKVLAKEYERLFPATRHLVEDLAHE